MLRQLQFWSRYRECNENVFFKLMLDLYTESRQNRSDLYLTILRHYIPLTGCFSRYFRLVELMEWNGK